MTHGFAKCNGVVALATNTKPTQAGSRFCSAQRGGLLLVLATLTGCAHDARRVSIPVTTPHVSIEQRFEPTADGRPRDLVPANFLSPEQQAGEQLASRITAVLNR